jgi:DASS family divalent anion:Na+ symporter
MGGGAVQGRLIRALVAVGTGVLIWFLPVPSGLKPEAWHLFAVFAATILGLILQPLPMGATVLTGITVAGLLKLLALKDVLSGFSNSVVWLIVAAFMFARGFVKTGLGRRIAFSLIKAFGRTSLGLAYSVLVSDLVISPATPSNTARAGGVIFPIVKSLAAAHGSEPGPTARRIGSYLMLTEFHGNLVTSAMFITACAPNTLIVELAAKALKVNVAWGTWALAALVPGIVGLVLVPLVMYKLCPPELKASPEGPALAARELEAMGPMSRAEKMMVVVFVATLLAWATGQVHKIDATLVALAGVCFMVVSGVVEWQDVLAERGGWDALVWFGGLVALATGLSQLGFVKWLAESVAVAFRAMNWVVALVGVVVVYLYAHYFFASLAAHVTAMFVPFATVAIASGAPPLLAVLALAYFSNLMASTTHYGTGPAPIYFGAGYVDQGTWWRIGLIMSFVNLAIWLGLGGLWWKVLGLW